MTNRLTQYALRQNTNRISSARFAPCAVGSCLPAFTGWPLLAGSGQTALVQAHAELLRWAQDKARKQLEAKKLTRDLAYQWN